MSQVQEIRKSLNTNQSRVAKLDAEVSTVLSKINEYDTSIQNYSDICSSIVRTSAESNSQLDVVLKFFLTTGQKHLQENHTNTVNRLVDIQWRSMRQNLIFTGINKLYLHRGQNEDCESTLVHFLRTEMHISFDIRFHRVHRPGRFKRM